ncbi:Arm DNA-binding domain-containing protein [Pantoea sp. B65]
MLTDTQCRAAKPKNKLYRLNDFDGLYLEVKPNGRKAWRYRFKQNGKSTMFALGEYPDMKLAEARQKCQQAHQKASPVIAKSAGVIPVESP